ncbi:MAG: CoA pyrophosphatase [Solobacterium sp.]|nr:CoA pyrophosphatase [Solobacterium sp.]
MGNRPEEMKKRILQDPSAFTKDRGAVILIPLLYEEDEWKLLYEVRASGLRTQPGEVCFPGGRIEPGESTREAVVRECMEELCIREEQLEDLVCLGSLPGPRGHMVTVYTGVLKDYRYTFAKDESDAVFSCGVEDLQKLEAVQTVREAYTADEEFFRSVPGGLQWLQHPAERRMTFYGTEPVIWGFTARVTERFLSLWAELPAGDE